MGFFTNYKDIGRINVLVKQIESKLDFIANEAKYPEYANSQRLKIEARTLVVLMNEIMDIVNENGSRSLFLSPFFIKGNKVTLPELSEMVAHVVETIERL